MTMASPPAERLLRWAQLHFDQGVVRDVIEPAVADLRYELEGARSDEARARIQQRGRLTLVRTCVAALALGLRRRWAGSSWWLLLVPTAIMVLASRALETHEPDRAGQHLLFGAVGVALAVLLAAWPLKAATERPARVTAVLIAAAVVLVVFLGESFGGARRWLTVGPLTVHVAALLTPLFTWVLLRWRDGAPHLRTAFVSLCALALALQPNLPVCLLWACIAVSATEGAQRAWVFVGSALAIAFCVVQAPQLASMAHESAMPILIGSHNPTWALLTLVGLFVPALLAWRGRGAASQPWHREATTFAVLFSVWPLLCYFDEGLVLLSYGGSMMVAYLGCVGLLLRTTHDRALASR